MVAIHAIHLVPGVIVIAPQALASMLRPCLRVIVNTYIIPIIKCAFCAPDVDVTITHGSGVLVGACNYAHENRRIRVRVDTVSPCRSLREKMKFTCETQDSASVLEAEIPGRDIAAFHFE